MSPTISTNTLDDNPFVLTTPVAFLVFNRPDLTERVFSRIAEAKPQTLLLIADGPRNANETALCDQVRKIVNRIDWECKVLRNFSDVNLGCKHRVASGL